MSDCRDCNFQNKTETHGASIADEQSYSAFEAILDRVKSLVIDNESLRIENIRLLRENNFLRCEIMNHKNTTAGNP